MPDHNPNARLEAFSDGVFAIAITLLVIELKVPSLEKVHSAQDLWGELQHMLPAMFAVVLSFMTILITWVNHHAALKLVDKTSHPFIYANGFMLLTVAIMPFPTAVLGEYILTDFAAPAVVIYALTFLLQAIAWVLVGGTAVKAKPAPLTRNDAATARMRDNYKKGYYAMAVYAGLAVAAYWFPLVVAALIALMWIGWLILGIRMKHE